MTCYDIFCAFGYCIVFLLYGFSFFFFFGFLLLSVGGGLMPHKNGFLWFHFMFSNFDLDI